MSDTLKQKSRCRICGHSELAQFLDLGDQPPANALLRADELQLPEAKYPLALSHCPRCELIQTTHVVAPKVLFRNYVYFSSVSQAMEKHFAAYAQSVAERFARQGGLFMELGSNGRSAGRTSYAKCACSPSATDPAPRLGASCSTTSKSSSATGTS